MFKIGSSWIFYYPESTIVRIVEKEFATYGMFGKLLLVSNTAAKYSGMSLSGASVTGPDLLH